MREFNRGQLSALKEMLADPQSHIRQTTAADILGNVLKDESAWEAILSDESDGSDPSSPDGCAAASRAGGLEEIREFGRKLFCEDISLSEAVRKIRERFGLTQGELARMIGSSPAALSRAMNGNERSIRHVLAAMTEFFWIDGGAGSADCLTGRTSRTGRTKRGTEAEEE